MAQIDFSNARIEPYNTNPVNNNTNYVSLNNAYFSADSGGTTINENVHANIMSATNNRIVIRYYGQMKAGVSGTSFAMGSMTWRVSNISYSGGDTYDFTIGCDLTCN